MPDLGCQGPKAMRWAKKRTEAKMGGRVTETKRWKKTCSLEKNSERTATIAQERMDVTTGVGQDEEKSEAGMERVCTRERNKRMLIRAGGGSDKFESSRGGPIT